jgi:DNA-binding IclR family transcriptional regulator
VIGAPEIEGFGAMTVTPRSRPEPAAVKSVLGKTRLIIEAFTADDDALSLTDLVRRTGMAKATVYRLAQELLGWGLLERVDRGYQLGLRLFEIGQRVPRQRLLREAALPYMEDLLLATQETIHLAIRDGFDVLYVEKIVVHRGVRKQSRVAGRLPLFCTATGKAILAYSPEGLLEEVISRGLTPLTRHTVIAPTVLRAQVSRARADGFAVENDETRLGYSSVAVPVFSGERTLVGALSVTAPTVRTNVRRLTGALRAAGDGIGRTLQQAC